MNKMLSQIINISKNPNINCDVVTLIRHLSSLYASDYEYNGSMDLYSVFYKPYMKFLTNINKKLKNDEKIDFYLKINTIANNLKGLENLNINLYDSNINYRTTKDLDFLSLARLQDLSFIDTLITNLDSVFHDRAFIHTAIAILSNQYYEIGNDIDKLNLFKNSLHVLCNMTENLKINSYKKGTILSVIQDIFSGEATDFINENLYNQNILFDDYICSCVDTSKLSKEIVNRIKTFSRQFCIREDLFEDDFNTKNDWPFLDEEWQEEESYVKKEVADEFQYSQDVEEKTMSNTFINMASKEDDEEYIVEYIDVVDDDESDDFDEDFNAALIEEVDDEEDDLKIDQEIRYNLEIIAKNHPDDFSHIVEILNDILDVDNTFCLNVVDKNELVKSLIFEISHPFLISQYAGTCLTTSIEFFYCLNEPVRYLELVKEKYINVLFEKNEYDENKVHDFKRDNYDYYMENYPSLAFFQTIGDNIYRSHNNIHTDVFANLGLNITASKVRSTEINSRENLISDINLALDNGQVVFVDYKSSYTSFSSHEIVLLSPNRNEQGEVVSYNVFDPNGIGYNKNVISVSRLKFLIFDAEFIDNDLTKI